MFLDETDEFEVWVDVVICVAVAFECIYFRLDDCLVVDARVLFICLVELGKDGFV